MNILLLSNHFNAGGISSYILNLAKGLALKGDRVYVGSSGGEWVRRLEELRIYPEINCREGGIFSRAEARSKDDGVAEGALCRGRATQPQAQEKMASLPTSDFKIGSNIKHIYLPLNTKSIVSPKLLFAYFILKRIIKEEKIDIVHTQTRVTTVLAYWLSKNTGVSFVYTAHGFFKPRLARRLFPCLPKLVIAISEPVKEHLMRDFHLSRERIRLVHNGIDSVSCQLSVVSSKEDIRKKFGLEDGPVVGIVARLSEVKGHKYLLTAIKQVKEKIPEVQLLSIGEGKIKKELEALAQKLGIEKEVYFIPNVPDTAEAFLAMDVFVMPSLEEGLGLAIMEAMLAGIPAVASSVGGIPSLIKDGSTGILVKPKDPDSLAAAIIGLLKDKEKAMRLADAASEFIRREFSLEKMACETQEVYRECLTY